MVMSIGLLGPFELSMARRSVAIGRRRERLLLAVLALEANRVVPAARLVDLLWLRPPPTAHRMVHTHASRVRSVLARLHARGAGIELSSRGNGYVLVLDPECIDVFQFQGRVRRAAALSGQDRAELLRSALDLWRGEFLQGLGDEVRDRLGAGLREQRLAAVEDWAATELALGRHRELVAELVTEPAAIGEAEPVRERLVELHMLALHQAGRTADALAVYGRVRARLVADYGVEPGRALRETQLAILRDDVTGLPRPVSSGGALSIPAQLPRPASHFVGRRPELELVVGRLTGRGSAGGPAVVAIHGPGGVGKSALAVVAAHKVMGRFPDGQLYIDLQGSGEPPARVAAIDALGRFLRTLGVPPGQVPREVDEAAALYRSLLTGRRLLLVADNAADLDQIAPLLPATAGCAVMVTSRPVLSTLDGAVQVGLGTLPAGQAQSLLRQVVGHERAATEPAAVAEVAAACGHLPLALRIAAARMVARADWSFADLARRLSSERNVLHELADRDDTLSSNLRVTLRTLKDSGSALDRLAGNVFVALGAVDVPDVAPGLAAALAGVTPQQAELALDRLVEARLLDCREGRYRPHDLVRRFAAAQARELAVSAREETLQSALSWYVNSAVLANRLMHGTVHARHFPTEPGKPAAQLKDAAEAGEWLDAERANLPAIGRQGLVASPDTARLAGRLLHALYPSLVTRGLAYQWEQLCRSALMVADPVREPSTVFAAAKGLAVLFRTQLRLDEALEHLRTAFGVQERLNDPFSVAGLLEIRGTIQVSRGNAAEAFADLEAALELRRRLDDLDGVGVALCNLAEAHFRFGRPERSLACLRESLELRRSRGNMAGEVITLANLAEVQAGLGRHAEALESAWEAVRRSAEFGFRADECRSRILCAQLLFRTGRTADGMAECDRVLRLAEAAGSIVDNGMVKSLADALSLAGRPDYAAYATERLRRLGAAPP